MLVPPILNKAHQHTIHERDTMCFYKYRAALLQCPFGSVLLKVLFCYSGQKSTVLGVYWGMFLLKLLNVYGWLSFLCKIKMFFFFFFNGPIIVIIIKAVCRPWGRSTTWGGGFLGLDFGSGSRQDLLLPGGHLGHLLEEHLLQRLGHQHDVVRRLGQNAVQ